MIEAPLNDRACLGDITATMATLVETGDPAIVDVAARFDDTRALARWVRSLPQRDDLGTPGDGPRIHACSPPQRLRVAPADPNCVERAALYLGAAELIDPRPVRALTTIDVPGGRHTLPVEDGAPVVLDPGVSRNVARAELWRAARMRNGAAPVALSPTQAVDWIALLATEPAGCFAGGVDRVRAGHRAMRALLRGDAVDADQVADIAFVLGLAHHEAHHYGDTGRCIVGTTAIALDRIDRDARRNGTPELRVGRYRVRPDVDVLGRLGRVGGRLGYKVGLVALRAKLATLGFSPPVVDALERELNTEGLSLGPLAARPPLPGTLAALTPDALAGRWLAERV